MDTPSMGGMDEAQGAPAAAPPMDASPEPQESSSTSVFLSQESLGGMKVKEGDRITLTVKSADPETGEVEAVVDQSPTEGEQSPLMDAFDKAVPESA